MHHDNDNKEYWQLCVAGVLKNLKRALASSGLSADNEFLAWRLGLGRENIMQLICGDDSGSIACSILRSPLHADIVLEMVAAQLRVESGR